MKKNIFSVIFIALATTCTVHAQNINSLNNYKYVVMHAAVADEGVPKFQKFKPELETGLKNLLALNYIPLIADETEGIQKGAKSCDIITCTYTITYSNVMMYGAKISCAFTFIDCLNKEILTVSGTKGVGAAVGVDGYLKLFTEIMKPNNSYKYNYIQPQEQTTDKPQSLPNQDVRQTVTPSEQSNNKPTAVAEKIVSDVDINIPAKVMPNANRFALIIGNEDYHSNQLGLSAEADVEFAAHDATTFKEYAIKLLGVPEENIIFMTNARVVEMNRSLDKLALLSKATGGDAEIFFYYAGHGYPDEVTKEAYIVPVDVNGSDLKYALKLKDVYDRLTAYQSKRVAIFLDACFSGGAREQPLVANRGIKIAPKETTITGNEIVFSATSNDQSAMAYKSKGHGIFTYFLLKKLQESKGDISYGELFESLQKQVSVKSILENSQEQTPTVTASITLGDSWKAWLVK